MKSKFSTLDIYAVIFDLKQLIGMRIVNVYDIDSRTYLMKLHKPSDKAFILFECGARIHRTYHDWPKSQVPSGFSMKFRKHINQKRLTGVNQVGADRIVDMQFGDDDRACHVIVELYDRGNIILTDSEYIILNVLRPRTDHDNDVRFSVKERYPLELARKETFLPSLENIALFLESAKPDEYVRKALVRHVPFSGQLLEHGFVSIGLPSNTQVRDLGTVREGTLTISRALEEADKVMKQISQEQSKGYITLQRIKRSDGTEAESYQEYHPFCFAQFKLPDSKLEVQEFPTFSEAIDKFYSLLDEQKLDQKAIHAEKEAIKKLNNVKKDHERRVKALDEHQESQHRRAELIEMNRDLVDQCILVVRQFVANKLPWDEIDRLLKMAAAQSNPVGKAIIRVNLAQNEITLRLTDPYAHLEDDSDSETDKKPKKIQTFDVEVDLDLNADQNCRKFFGDKKAAVEKKHRTLQASSIALKNAQKQTQNKVEQVRVNTTIARARKTMWFEKFYWCLSSDGFLIIGGRDAQQNEALVKRYLRPGDVYVHADLHGASSVVVRNKTKDQEIPPMTLNEAGSMAVCYSTAWEAKIAVNAWWVYHHQVSRTAQTGEYLPPGSFMIRGKKNFLPSVHLQLGFGLFFRLDEESTQKHLAEAAEKISSSRVSVDTEEPKDNINEEEEEGEELKGDDEDANDEENDEFPDVELKLDDIRLDSTVTKGEDDEDFTLIQLIQPVREKNQREKYLEEKAKIEAEEEKNREVKAPGKDAPMTKRQKHKLDKIKKKYADQTEDERSEQLRKLGAQPTKVLNKLKKGKAKKKTAKDEDLPEEVEVKQEEEEPEIKEEGQEEQKEEENEEKEEKKEEQEEEEEEPDQLEGLDQEEAVLKSLCPHPRADDGILFVVAVCAPYSAMQKFKYKVKITPGTGKRGRAVKTALELFQKDKTATQAERNLVKSLVSDPSVVQSLPGKVRVSAPALMRSKAK
ncbi:unnamed protein product [Bursaphelenchus xylophilus]|uniref:(pine wood nematode) hypothetical protein n=1 Tax=Bursaphelenchus xylophilus TaxID=6326 RepID=A0A1I7SLF7_BURXY|nr:unnamed protein product [Bursaphelenchus xylophilus]CAG9129563.1 unnamed protein product [Bursaphelenchus xylophilus]